MRWLDWQLVDGICVRHKVSTDKTSQFNVPIMVSEYIWKCLNVIYKNTELMLNGLLWYKFIFGLLVMVYFKLHFKFYYIIWLIKCVCIYSKTLEFILLCLSSCATWTLCSTKSLAFSHRTTSWTVTNLASEVDIRTKLPCSQLLKI